MTGLPQLEVDEQAAPFRGAGFFSPVHKDRYLPEAALRREGTEGLGANNEARPEDGKDKVAKGTKRRGQAADDVSKALRSAYDEAVRESIPDDFLDLLGKLN